MKRKMMLLMTCLFIGIGLVNAQISKVTGTVISEEDGLPVVGAAIVVKGTQLGTVTDLDGKFVLENLPSSAKTLMISFIGMKTVETKIENGLTIYLKADSELLDEVVVVAYGTARKESLTGSVAQIDNKKIEQRVATSATAALEGAAPGVQVNNSYGEPGAGPSILIRGIGTITGSTTPLYVVDGVPYDGNINDISSHDIEAISVLKDAASAALYGNRAANGVVIITTKTGRNAGRPAVTLKINQGFYNRGIAEYDRLDANRWMETEWLGYKNYAMSNPAMGYSEAEAAAYATANLIPDLVKSNIYNKADDQLFDANGKLVAQIKPGYTDLDWFDGVERNGHRQEYVASAQASTDKFNISASVSYLNEKGYIKATDFERFSGFANATFTPSKFFDARIKLQASTQLRNYNPNANGSYYANPFYQARYMAPVYPMYVHDADGNIMYDNDGNPIHDTESVYLDNRNIVYELDADKQERRRNTLDGTVALNFHLPFNINFHVLGNMDNSTTNRMAYNNPLIGDGATNNGRLSSYAYQYRTWNVQQQLTWNWTFADKHNVDVLLGHENYGYWMKYTYGMKTGMNVPGNNFTLGNFATVSSLTGYDDNDRSESYLARLNYNFDTTYFLSASYRRDGSSRFHPDNRWGDFFSFGGRWNAKREAFLEDVNWINSLSLRASYGEVGNNMGIGYYAYQALYEITTNGGDAGLLKSQLAANDVKWETTQNIDVAVEGRLFDRMNFSVGYFDKRSKDLLFEVKLPLSAGSYPWGGTMNMTQLQNIGTISNRGFEIAADVDIIKTKDWTWNVGVDATILDSEIIKLPNGEDILNGTQKYSEGHPVREWFTYHFEGVDQMTGRSLYTIDPEQKAAAEKAGALVTINGQDYTTVTTYGKKDWCGKATPSVYGAITSNLTWKDLSLGMTFTYSLGGKVYDSSYRSLMTGSATSAGALHEDALKAWNGVPEGMTETSPNRIDPNGIPSMDFYHASDNNTTSDRWLTSGSYLIFKNLNIAYNVPTKLTKALGLQGLSVMGSIDNLFTLTSRKGLNPQYSFTGTQDATYVSARAFNLGVNIKF